MCLILVAWRMREDYPLVVAANRDEYYARPTAVAAAWPECPGVFGGRDLEAGGTWLGATDSGRFAAVTNVREPGGPPGRRSRGHLAADFLVGNDSPAAYLSRVSGDAHAGFNLILGDADALWYASNRDGPPRQLAAGIYGLSNHRLDTPWPKLTSAKQRFAAAVETLPEEAAMFSLLADDDIVPDEQLPDTGVPLAWERLLSAVFVKSPTYGTRAATLLLRSARGSSLLVERGFGVDGVALGETRLRFAPYAA